MDVLNVMMVMDEESTLFVGAALQDYLRELVQRIAFSLIS